MKPTMLFFPGLVPPSPSSRGRLAFLRLAFLRLSGVLLSGILLSGTAWADLDPFQEGLYLLEGYSHLEDVPEDRRRARISSWTSFPGELLFIAPTPGDHGARLLSPDARGLKLLASKHESASNFVPRGVEVLHTHGRYAVIRVPARLRGRLAERMEHCTELMDLPRNAPVVRETGSPQRTRTPDPAIAGLLGNIDRERLKRTTKDLVDFQTRYTFSPGYEQALEYSRTILDQSGLTTRIQEFPMFGGTARNLIAVLPGRTHPDEIYLIGAHLDSTSWQADTFAPGADDNASGSAGVLELARVLADVRLERTVWFVLYAGEEQGLHGSKALVESLRSDQRLETIKGVFNLDMIGYNKQEQLRVMLETRPLARSFLATISQAAQTYTDLEVHQTFHAWGSDHIPFLEAGIPAVLTFEYEYDDNPHDHTPLDTLEHVNFDLVRAILRTDLAALLMLAGPATPR